MIEVKEQCKSCFHFQVCANVLKQQLYIREKMLNEENPKCEHYTPTADVVDVETIEQLKWERDTAIKQLQSYGVGLCEDKELVEVKHGEWIKSETECEEYKCSVCGGCAWYYSKNGYIQKSNFCPNCYARMDGKT